MKTYKLTLGLHSKVWEIKEKKDHQTKVEEAFELEGIQYISNPRPSQRGGGAAISLISGDFTLTRLEVLVPKNLEVIWGLVRPVNPTEEFKGIIVCSIYSQQEKENTTNRTHYKQPWPTDVKIQKLLFPLWRRQKLIRHKANT